ncbi:MAG: potassium/proton antiporter [Ectothiorhodospiraceae bacterium]|nr:potassium/proton antiporter [Ectothiorhodospiraceae bacterium]
MDWMYLLILVSAGLIVISVLTSALAFRFGAPLLLVFLCIGLIAGEDGLGLLLDDVEVAYFIGSLALAVILFDSGFGTRAQTLRRAAAPAVILATVGVFFTTLLVGLAARFLFDLPWPHAFLIGAVISSTDAAAVFFLLRTGGVKIYKRVRSILEVESGSNDPMAIFLTIFFIELILHGAGTSSMTAKFFTQFGMQMGAGVAAGLVAGYLIVEIVNRIDLEEALYPIAVMASALCVFAVTGYIGGSGFLAVYIAGIVAGNRGMRGAGTLRRYQNGMTWLAQIVMFLILGLIVTPSQFIPVALPAIALGLFLIFIGRPIAVWLCLLPFRYDIRTVAFTSWVGLRGAVSILLGILPAVAGVENADLYLNVAFIMVLTSLLIQGWTIRPAASQLDLIVPPQTGPVERMELELPGSPSQDLVVYRVLEGSSLLASKQLPRWARPSMVVREGTAYGYHQLGELRIGDYVYVFVAPEYVKLLDRLFARPQESFKDDKEFFGDLRLSPDASIADLGGNYDLALPEDLDPEQSIGDYMSDCLGQRPVVGDRVPLGSLELVVRGVHRGEVVTDVGLAFRKSRQAPAYTRLAEADLKRLLKRVGRLVRWQ